MRQFGRIGDTNAGVDHFGQFTESGSPVLLVAVEEHGALGIAGLFALDADVAFIGVRLVGDGVSARLLIDTGVHPDLHFL